jgi:hypothetical protein
MSFNFSQCAPPALGAQSAAALIINIADSNSAHTGARRKPPPATPALLCVFLLNKERFHAKPQLKISRQRKKL